jgi:hypothetical protein
VDLFVQAPSVNVELDVFYGRPNPRWTLAGDGLDAVRERGRGLGSGKMRDLPGLGYRGFVLTADHESVRAFDGMLRLECGERTDILRDHRCLEELLVAQACDLGFGDMLARFHGPTFAIARADR